MNVVKIKDKQFRVSIPEAEIKTRIKALAAQISKDMEGKNPLFLGVLNGSFIFAADLMRESSATTPHYKVYSLRWQPRLYPQIADKRS